MSFLNNYFSYIKGKNICPAFKKKPLFKHLFKLTSLNNDSKILPVYHH